MHRKGALDFLSGMLRGASYDWHDWRLKKDDALKGVATKGIRDKDVATKSEGG